MDDLIDDLTKIPLSGDDLIDIAVKLGKERSTMAWITYTSLNDVGSINDLFKDGQIDSIFILIQPEGQTIGHWVTLGSNEYGIFYYDPYGIDIEQDAQIAKSDRLIVLLMGHMVDVNKFMHQKFGTDNGSEINTCGRHDAVRAFFSWMTNAEYNEKIIMPLIIRKQVKDPDIVVNLLTAFLSSSDKVIEQFLME